MDATVSVQPSKWKAFFKKKDRSVSKPLDPNSEVIESVPQKQSNEPTNQSNKTEGQKPQTRVQERGEGLNQESRKQTQCQHTSDSLTGSWQQKNNQENYQPSKSLLGQAKKFISILELKNSKKKQFPQAPRPQQLKIPQQPQLHEYHKHQRTKTKLKTGHFKIFNPEHFEVKDQQTKTSIHRWIYGSGETPQKLLIHSWNVNGIRARMKQNQFLPYLKFYNPDILCINETKLDQKSYLQNPYKFWGYYSYWNFPKYSLGYSGVAVFSKYPAIQMFEDIHLAEHSKEGRVITLEFDKFVLINIYVPTTGRNQERLDYRVKEYDPAFREYVLKTKEKFPLKTMIICGDLNVAHNELDCHIGKRMEEGKQPAFTVKERVSFTTLLKSANLVDTFRRLHPNQRRYTWWNIRRGGKKRNGQVGIGKRLDYFLVDEPSMKYVKASEIKKDVEGCDHCPIELRIEFS